MPIAWFPNDPEAKGVSAPSRITAHKARGSGKSDFDLGKLPAQKVWPFESREFLDWQCREALLRSLDAWEKVAGPLQHWHGGARRKKLRVDVDAGEDINAYYDRASLGFFHFTSSRDGRLRRFAASADVVAHETGHAFLDVIRPSLWDSNFPEPNAFHEAFGDCMAILTALADASQRKSILDGDVLLAKANDVEILMESLANAVRDEAPKSVAAQARRGRNTYQWALPTTLPDRGGPGDLVNEVHSFGQVFVGCFYDVIRNVHALAGTPGATSLRKAAEVAGMLLVRAAVKAPHLPRFFQALGRAMVLEDEALHGGRHRDAIGAAFGAHNILLGSNAAIAPRSALRGKATTSAAKAVGRDTLDDLKGRMNLPSATPLQLRCFEIGGRAVVEACHVRPVALDGLAEQLAGVVAYGTEPALIGTANRRPAVLGALPDARSTEDEVRAYVAGLVERDAIVYAGTAGGKGKGRRNAIATTSTGTPTHVVVQEGTQRVLKRIRYACACRTW